MAKINFGSITKFSRTHSYSMLFFPSSKREDVKKLYLFCRYLDDIVDESNRPKELLEGFISDYNRLAKASQTIIDAEVEILPELAYIIELTAKYNFDPDWIEAMFVSMKMDLEGKTYQNLAELEVYMYGVAGVVGLMVAAILELPKESYPHAIALGNSAQYINMIRDIHVDQQKGRTYLPMEELTKYGLTDLSKDNVTNKSEAFTQMIKGQEKIFAGYLQHARDGFKYIPRRYQAPVKAIARLYEWTMQQILHNPLVVYQKIVKPGKLRAISAALRSLI